MEKLNYEKNYFIKKEISNYKPYYDNPFNQQLYNLINKEKKDGNLLEIGCAFGYFLKYAEKNFETYGIDISNYAISQAKKITNKTKFFIFDIEKDFPKDIANKRFDVIIALDILEHLKKPSLIIKRLNKLLKKKGVLIIRTPNTSAIDFKLFKFLGLEKKLWHGCTDKTHVSVYNLEKWIDIIKNNNFNIKIISHFPTKFLKRIVANYFPKLFFLPSFFRFMNSSITFYCKKIKQ